MDVIVTVGVILLLIALTALVIHLMNVHREQRITAFDYERFHAGDPPEEGGGRTEPGERGTRDEGRER